MWNCVVFFLVFVPIFAFFFFFSNFQFCGGQTYGAPHLRNEFVARRSEEIIANLTVILQGKFTELESQLIAKFSDIETRMQSSGGATPGQPAVSTSATSGGGATNPVTGGAPGGGYERRRGYLPGKKTVPEEFSGEDLREWRDWVEDMEAIWTK